MLPGRRVQSFGVQFPISTSSTAWPALAGIVIGVVLIAWGTRLVGQSGSVAAMGPSGTSAILVLMLAFMVSMNLLATTA